MSVIDEAKRYPCPGCSAEPTQECYALNLDDGIAMARHPEDANWVHSYRLQVMRFNEAQTLMRQSL